MSKQATLVLIPSWGMGHVIPMTQLAKLFTTTTTFSVAVVLFQPPYDVTSTIDPFVTRVTSTHPSISFHRLPEPSLPPNHLSDGRQPFGCDVLRFTNPQLAHFLASFTQSCNISALIFDTFCSASLDVARELNIPAYIFFSSGVSALATFAQLPTIQSQMISSSFRDLGKTPLPLPRLPPVPASNLPVQLLDRDTEISRAYMFHFERIPKVDGIIVNSFEALEVTAVKAAKDGMYGPMPPIYCIGPLTVERSDEFEKHECLKWLDKQPNRSVVFLCFGSMGSFTVDQLKEIAVGLEKSGQRFLWVVRAPLAGPDTGEKRIGLGKDVDPDIEVFLPEGFVEWAKGRGMVVKLWAPQVAVLEHEAVGGFVTHCGWNSTLEAVSAGVAMIAWPLYAEQKMNKVFLVEDAKVAVEMEGSCDEEMVKAEEVEKKVRWLMASEGGRELKERVEAMRECAVRARMKGGPSDQAWTEFVQRLDARAVCQ